MKFEFCLFLLDLLSNYEIISAHLCTGPDVDHPFETTCVVCLQLNKLSSSMRSHLALLGINSLKPPTVPAAFLIAPLT